MRKCPCCGKGLDGKNKLTMGKEYKLDELFVDVKKENSDENRNNS